LYWGSGSGPSWRVALALKVKKLPYESRLLSFAKREHKSPEMLAMNPRGKVPVLRDGDYTLYESLAILGYLDRKYPETPIFGRTPEEAGLVLRTVMEHEAYGNPAISAANYPLLFNRLPDQRETVVMALPQAHEELSRLEAQLTGPYLVGDAVSAADLFVYPAVRTIERAFGKPAAADLEAGLEKVGNKYPRLGAWLARIQAIPGYDETYPPHWRDG
jgi:glutathione S-transferase